ncbi:hypothetical protein FUAX_37920 [Fulvitalea axinellae]|uniref:CarboxypepD_reg-like domain-containing protein n=1 Tax=Fulvitalea axinellae TaxID=1182444 RepID=A0AAU9CPQ1_9BACT|nr:hypothetical protein FUAX_37920 [Fulvitalea axinellae]
MIKLLTACLVFFSLVIFTPNESFGQQKYVDIHLRLADSATAKPVVGAVVTVAGTLRSVSDKSGAFKFTARDSDTLRVSHLNFKDTLFLAGEVEKFEGAILLNRKVYMLPTLEFKGHSMLKAYYQAMDSLKKWEFATNADAREQEQLWEWQNRRQATQITMEGWGNTPGMSPFSFFSKKAKNARRLMKVLEAEEALNAEDRAYEKRYSLEVVMTTLGITKEKAEPFMEWYRPDTLFVMGSGDAELFNAIWNAYSRFTLSDAKETITPDYLQELNFE